MIIGHLLYMTWITRSCSCCLTYKPWVIWLFVGAQKFPLYEFFATHSCGGFKRSNKEEMERRSRRCRGTRPRLVLQRCRGKTLPQISPAFPKDQKCFLLKSGATLASCLSPSTSEAPPPHHPNSSSSKVTSCCVLSENNPPPVAATLENPRGKQWLNRYCKKKRKKAVDNFLAFVTVQTHFGS